MMWKEPETWLLMGALILLIALVASCTEAKAHEAPSGWTYPNACCRDHQDCEHIHLPKESVEFFDDKVVVTVLPGGHKRATEKRTPIICEFPFSRKYSTGEVYKNPDVRESGDNDDHVCIGSQTMSDYKCRCVYLAPRGL